MASNYSKPSGKHVTVAPENMGKGLGWNSTTNQFDVNIKEAGGITTNEKGEVGLKLSPDAGNLLELRSNGVYYGIVPTQSDIYVSTSLGSDTNTGTRNAPFKSLKAALSFIRLQKTAGSYTIHLRSGETFGIYDANVYLGSGRYGLTFLTYDDTNYNDTQDFNIYHTWELKEYTRAKLEFDTYTGSDGLVRCASISCGNGFDLILKGIDLNLKSSSGKSSSGGSYFYQSLFDFRGCILRNTGVMAMGSATVIRLDTCIIEEQTSAYMFQADSHPSMYYITPPYEGKSVSSNGISGTVLTSNVKQKLTINNSVGNSSYDKNTKTLFGYSTNWDIFNYS